MQDRYTGDVGDFGKYGLLRHFCGHLSDTQALRLGIVWYLTPDETHNKDGGHIEYLEESAKNDEMYRACDPELYDSLSRIVSDNDRRVARIKQALVFAQSTVFYNAPLTFAGMPGNGPAARGNRLDHRKRWVQGALEATLSCDLVFVDPDKGLEVKLRPHRMKGPKYVYYDELMPFYKRGQSLVIYQHIHRKRNETAEIQVDQRLTAIRERTGSAEAFALLYHRGTARAFFVVPSRDHRRVLLERAQEFVRGPWGQFEHFELILPSR